MLAPVAPVDPPNSRPDIELRGVVGSSGGGVGPDPVCYAESIEFRSETVAEPSYSDDGSFGFGVLWVGFGVSTDLNSGLRGCEMRDSRLSCRSGVATGSPRRPSCRSLVQPEEGVGGVYVCPVFP